MITSSNCVACLVNKQIKFLQDNNIDKDEGLKFLKEVIDLLDNNSNNKAPGWNYSHINDIKEKFFNYREDYKEIKHKYNSLLLGFEEKMDKRIWESSDPLLEGIKYSLLGNYIDFAALDDFNDEKLLSLLDEASKNEVDEKTYTRLKEDLTKAKSVVFLTDNCGEIVFDKLFIKQIKKFNPNINVYAILRGEDTINDATIEDAKEVGLDKLCTCMGNGNPYPTTIIEEMDDKSKEILLNADVIISKGQGNFEGLYKSGLNIYYCFLVKCNYFVRKFGLERLSSVVKREEDIVTYLD